MTVWLVDDRWVFRFPRREGVIPGLINEIAHLPRLAPLLPLPIPSPTYLGKPPSEYGWPFYGARFLPGRELAETGLDDISHIALADAHSESSFERSITPGWTPISRWIRSEERI